MSTHTLNLTPAIYQYFQAHAYRELPILTQLREKTLARFPELAHMEISPEQGQFMHLLAKMIQARKILEIGTFTGYSALWMALALPANGKLVTCDIDAVTTGFAQDFWRQAGVNEKIELRLAPALATLPELLAGGGADSFDLAFI